MSLRLSISCYFSFYTKPATSPTPEWCSVTAEAAVAQGLHGICVPRDACCNILASLNWSKAYVMYSPYHSKINWFCFINLSGGLHIICRVLRSSTASLTVSSSLCWTFMGSHNVLIQKVKKKRKAQSRSVRLHRPQKIFFFSTPAFLRFIFYSVPLFTYSHDSPLASFGHGNLVLCNGWWVAALIQPWVFLISHSGPVASQTLPTSEKKKTW